MFIITGLVFFGLSSTYFSINYIRISKVEHGIKFELEEVIRKELKLATEDRYRASEAVRDLAERDRRLAEIERIISVNLKRLEKLEGK